MRPQTFLQKLDWPVIGVYFALVIIGCLSIFASIYDSDQRSVWDIFDTTQRYGSQLIWAATAIVIAIICLSISSKFYPVFAWPLYLIALFSLVAVLVVGTEINGSKSWFAIGSLRLQPAEFSKIACSLVLARIMSVHDFKLKTFRGIALTFALILLPPLLIVLENETGLALVFAAFFFSSLPRRIVGMDLDLWNDCRYSICTHHFMGRAPCLYVDCHRLRFWLCPYLSQMELCGRLPPPVYGVMAICTAPAWKANRFESILLVYHPACSFFDHRNYLCPAHSVSSALADFTSSLPIFCTCALR